MTKKHIDLLDGESYQIRKIKKAASPSFLNTDEDNERLENAKKVLKERRNINMDKFKKWLEQCPVEYDEIQETGDKDILTINFHGKDIYKRIFETQKEEIYEYQRLVT